MITFKLNTVLRCAGPPLHTAQMEDVETLAAIPSRLCKRKIRGYLDCVIRIFEFIST